MHLWEADHSYYCNLGNYYNNDCGAHHKSLAEFLAAEAGGDLDYNLVFRWDWKEGDDWGYGPYTGDDNYRNGGLEVFFMSQRKGIFRYATVEVCRADEPQVIEFLRPRLAHLMALWEPLTERPDADTSRTNDQSRDEPNPSPTSKHGGGV